MNFFEHQDLARRNTKRLVFLMALAVLALVGITTLLFAVVLTFANTNSIAVSQANEVGFWSYLFSVLSLKTFLTISLGVTSVVLLGSFFKFFQLKTGGRVIAESMGGRLINLNTRDHHERKMLNVVEEMAIASGIPVPPVYLLEENSINAFAAGHSHHDAVIGVTRGCINLLNRSELQGVVAHEFSHILHGDMRINMRLIAILHGILLLGLIGELLLRANRYNQFRSSRNKSPGAVLALGVGLVVIGYAGTFFWQSHQIRRQPPARISGRCLCRAIYSLPRGHCRRAQKNRWLCLWLPTHP